MPLSRVRRPTMKITRKAVACSDKDVRRPRRAMHEVLTVEAAPSLDEQDALAGENEEVLLSRLGVIQPARLSGPDHAEGQADVGNVRTSRSDARAQNGPLASKTQRAPKAAFVSHAASPTLTTNHPSDTARDPSPPLRDVLPRPSPPSVPRWAVRTIVEVRLRARCGCGYRRHRRVLLSAAIAVARFDRDLALSATSSSSAVRDGGTASAARTRPASTTWIRPCRSRRRVGAARHRLRAADGLSGQAAAGRPAPPAGGRRGAADRVAGPQDLHVQTARLPLQRREPRARVRSRARSTGPWRPR